MILQLNGIELNLPNNAQVNVSSDGKKVAITVPDVEEKIVEKIRIVAGPVEEKIVERIKVVPQYLPCNEPHFPCNRPHYNYWHGYQSGTYTIGIDPLGNTVTSTGPLSKSNSQITYMGNNLNDSQISNPIVSATTIGYSSI